MVADELVDEEDLGVYGCAECVRLCEEFILWIILYRADVFRPLVGWKGLEISEFLQCSGGQGYVRRRKSCVLLRLSGILNLPRGLARESSSSQLRFVRRPRFLVASSRPLPCLLLHRPQH